MDTNGNSKELLIKDLCSRLPYGVICKLSAKDADVSVTEKLDTGGLEHFIFGTMDVKPYLRPMSSMTEGEEIYYNTIYTTLKFYEKVDWLLSHHFDYRIDPSTGKTLIESNLAIEAPEDMYKNE